MNWFFALLFMASTALYAQPSNPHVKWTATSKKIGKNTYQLTFTADINPGWYVYSQYLESEDGPIATAVVFEETTDQWELPSPAKESGNVIKGYDELFGMNITKYKKQLVIRQVILVQPDQKIIKGYITFMSCNDEQCLPPTDVPFEVRL